MRNENFFACLLLCAIGCLLDGLSPIADVVSLPLGIGAGLGN